MKLKTSTKISLKFTLFASILLLIFSFLLIPSFFQTRYSKQQNRLHMREIRYERPLFFKFMKFDEKDFGTITTLQLGETSPFRPETTPFGEEPLFNSL
ncbi:MAG: hypothetical protein PHU61_04525 [Candidatus Absconditabacteria bacterium]|nr:hypothetical protein [Candidatus Absconditabacteria bacterium]MDD3868725.1 hypothetical protein [Candidatus Absconditabacteria bacterium]MDD4714776.1 hypothetical protein [Candidatus Absconditabacteria bacterium]